MTGDRKRLASFAARSLAALPPRLKQHARTRAAPLLLGMLGAGAISTYLPAITEATSQGVATALGSAVGGVVAPSDFVWAPSRGALVDAVWGRDLVFLSREGGPGAPALRDVHRARVTIAPGGRPLRVEAVAQETATPLADEHDLVARADVVAWAVRGRGGEHGATLSLPAATGRFAALGAVTAERRMVDVVFVKPAENVAIELREEGMVIAVRDGERQGRALVNPTTLDLKQSGEVTAIAVARRPAPAPPRLPWQPALARALPPESASVDAPIDATVFAPPLRWRAIAMPRPVVTSGYAAPAPVVQAVVETADSWVLLTGLDTRQLALRVVPAPAAPRSTAGLPGTGRLGLGEDERVVAQATVLPVETSAPGAIERGRVIAPLDPQAPRIAADERGHVSLLGVATFAPFGAVQTALPVADEPVAAWCAAATGAIIVAVARPPRREPIEKALAPLACTAIAWVGDVGVAAGSSFSFSAAPRFDAPGAQEAPFGAFLRIRAFPEGRHESWKASPGRQPSPAFLPGVLEHEVTVLGEPVHVTAFVEGRFSWALRVGARERSHRAGGTFPSTLEAALAARAIAAIDVGVGQRKRPNGLTIGGSTGHAYGSRGAVLFADEGGLSLLPSPEVREDPRVDAVELPLTASGGSPTPVALRRGLLQQRGDVCVLPDGTALVATARFDSHAATVEALCRLGCSEVAALDRGLDLPPELTRVGSEPLPPTHPVTRLIALDRGSGETP